MSAGDRLAADAAFEDWVARAQAVSCRALLERRAQWTRAMAGDAGNPCPACGGADRFAVNTQKNIFTCRKSGAAGGVLALWAHLQDRPWPLRGQDFLDACTDLTGQERPGREEPDAGERARRDAARHKALEDQAAARARADRDRALKDRTFRDYMRHFAWKLYRERGRPAGGTLVDDYFTLRGLPRPLEVHPRAGVRFCADLEIEEKDAGGVRRTIHRGPAMLWPMVGPDVRPGRDGAPRRAFAGVHVTWLDLDQPKGKIVKDHPFRAGERIDAKKTFASWRGAIIELTPDVETARRWIAGEGIETVYGALAGLHRARSALLDGLAAVSFINLQNYAGKAARTLAHPDLTATDSRGRVRPVRVAGPEPLWPDPARPVPLPECVADMIWLKDGDSEAVFTDHACRRGAARTARHFPHVSQRIADPGPGMDFHDLWQRQNLASLEGAV